MTTTTRHRRWSAALLAAAGLALATALPAQAGLNDPPVRPGEGITWGSGGAVKVKTMQTGGGSACSFIASPNSIGGVCVRANAFTGVTIEEILGGDPLPECWDERLTDEELRDINLVHGEGTAWYWHRCLRGIDPETFEIGPDGLHFQVGIWPFADGDPELTFLTPNQQAFVERFVHRGNVPAPVLVASPSPVPWVNDDVAFFNYGDDEVSVDLAAPGVQMRGRITEIMVYPEGPDGPAVTCPGSGVQVEADDTPQSVPDACWHAYEQSSLAQEGDAFEAEIYAKWQIDVRIGGTWRPFHEFSKGAPATVQVNEVQALVRP
jgi:hypothetical protein